MIPEWHDLGFEMTNNLYMYLYFYFMISCQAQHASKQARLQACACSARDQHSIAELRPLAWASVASYWRCPTSNRKCPARAATTGTRQSARITHLCALSIDARSQSKISRSRGKVSPAGLNSRSTVTCRQSISHETVSQLWKPAPHFE